MATKKHDDERPSKHEHEPDIVKREEAAKYQEEKAREHAEKRRPGTDDPLSSPPYDVFSPNPPSENK